MAPSFIEALQDAALAWGVPAAYATCCIVAHRLTAPKEIRVPDHLEPTHEAPPLHPLLLGALWFRKESELHNVENACEVTLAVVVRMIGRGLASFVESERSGHEAPKAAGASRREGLFSRLTQKYPSTARSSSSPFPRSISTATTVTHANLCYPHAPAAQTWRNSARTLETSDNTTTGSVSSSPSAQAISMLPNS